MKLQEYKVWDRTTRLFHWINVLCVVALMALGTAILNSGALGMSNDGKILLKTVHVYFGYVFALNLLWRLVWGFVGGPHARWRAILPVGRGFIAELKAEVWAWTKNKPANYIGHTPLGRIAVTAILLVLVVQGSTGLILAGTDVYMPPLGRTFAEQVKADGLSADQVRPYAPETVDAEAYQDMRAFRAPVVETHEILFWVILALVALHVAVVIIKDVRHGGTIISAMFTGRKAFQESPRDVRGP
ncbi:MAG: cytochrome b/b6 domain-containing protein [Rhodospirillaceae bacterium]|nr:cytochrome b/b6 domain-containing protein [Rhodospirillaceae bacterium]